jgi:hypothetical protein
MANLFESGHPFALISISDKVVIGFNSIPARFKIFPRNHLNEVAFIDADLSRELVVDTPAVLLLIKVALFLWIRDLNFFSRFPCATTNH